MTTVDTLKLEHEKDIEALNDLIGTVHTSVGDILSISFSVIGVAIAIAGGALYFLAKKWTQDAVAKGLVEIKKEILDDVKNYQVFSTGRSISIPGIQTVISNKTPKAIIINARFGDLLRTWDCNFEKSSMMWSVNGESYNKLKINCPNGSKVELQIKQVIGNNITLEWVHHGDEIPNVSVELDIMIF